MFSAEPPVLVRVSDNILDGCGFRGLIFSVPKLRLAGISLTTPAARVIVALLDFVLSVADVAVMVTLALAGTVDGAAYVVGAPLAVVAGVTVPQTAGVHAAPF